jgi:hypothetical protein
MRKLKLIAAMILILSLLAGCSFDIETIEMPELPEVKSSTSTLEGTVDYVNGRTCRVIITKGDSHFDAATEDDEADVIQLTYTNLEGSKTVMVGDTVSFEYDYSRQVSEYLGSPHITVNIVKIG